LGDTKVQVLKVRKKRGGKDHRGRDATQKGDGLPCRAVIGGCKMSRHQEAKGVFWGKGQLFVKESRTSR